MMAEEIIRRPDARGLLAWAAGRRCLLCRETAALHRVQTIEGSRGLRLALLRNAPTLHEFDPGERRRAPR